MHRSSLARVLPISATASLLVVALLSPAATAGASEVAAADPAAGIDSVIVAFDDVRAASTEVADVAVGDVTRVAPGVVTMEVDDAAAAVEALAEVDGVRYVEPDWPLTITSTPPNDPKFGELWALHNTGQSSGVPGADIAALSAWALPAVQSAGEVVVAIADSGIDAAHPDLTARMWRNPGGLGGCPAGSTGFDFVQSTCSTGTDPSGHGTHVAGTVGAAIGNGTGIAGVAPNATLLDLRIIDANGSGSTSSAVAAVNTATSLASQGVPIRVLNASWGGDQESIALRDAITAAGAAGIVVVTAAGNVGRNLDATPTYPCVHPSDAVICVAASTRTDALASYSNYGRTTVDVAAPGSAIASTHPAGYATWDGTSMAAPHVAGLAAMVAGACRSGVAGIRSAILAGVDPLPAFATTTASGGRVDAAAAVAAACNIALQAPGAPGPALLGPANPVLSWTPGDGTHFALQAASPGSGAWADLASGLTVASFNTAAVPEGRMDLRVIATRDGQTATSPATPGVVIDRSPPTISIAGCPTTGLTLGSAAAVSVTASDRWSGLSADPSGTRTLDTSTTGTRTASFTATDRVALSTTATCTYTVVQPPAPAPAGGGGGGAGAGGGGAVSGGTTTAPSPEPDVTEPLEEVEVAPPSPDRTPTEDATPAEPTPVEAVEVPVRIDEPHPSQAALTVSRLRFGPATTFATGNSSELGRVAQHAVLARDDAFADALAGAPLSADGPLLLTSGTELDAAVAEELERALAPGDTVYLLGGDAALGAAVEAAVEVLGFVPRRLAGASRIETALRIADEVRARGGASDDVLVARAYGPAESPTAAWADAISGGAYGAATSTPVVLTPTDALHPDVARWVREDGGDAILLGGTSALSADVAAALPGSVRVAGAERAATAAAVATELWGHPAPLATALLIDGWDEDGWAYGLAAAGLAADLDAPLLLLGGTVPPATAAVVGCDSTTIVGGTDTVDPAVEVSLEELCAS